MNVWRSKRITRPILMQDMALLSNQLKMVRWETLAILAASDTCKRQSV